MAFDLNWSVLRVKVIDHGSQEGKCSYLDENESAVGKKQIGQGERKRDLNWKM